MDLRHLRYFVAVAEERNFTRAAERLGIKQPPLSLQIRQLEQEMGTQLFHRLTRGVELTEAGALLFDEARSILEQVERAKANVRRRARGETGRIRIGFADATYFQPTIPGIIRAFRRLYPDASVALVQSNTPYLAAALNEGPIDVAFVRPPMSDLEGLILHLLVDEPMVIVLPSQHPHAGDHALSLAALAQETFILWPRPIGPGLYDSIIASCEGAGFSPTIGQDAPQLPMIVHLVAAGLGASIVPQSLAQIRAEGAVYLPIEGEAPRALISLAVRKDNRSATVRNFVALARRQAEAAG